MRDFLLVILPVASLLLGCPTASTTDTGPSGIDTGGVDTGGIDTGGIDTGGIDTGGGTDGGGGGTDGGGGDLCTLVPPLERGCTTDDNCIAAIHQTDCCGNMSATGANHSELTRFDAFEAICRASYPLCDCPSGPIATDSGETAADPIAIQVACVSRGPASMCMTYVTTRPADAP